MASFLIVERAGAVVTLTMNQPEHRNPLSGNTAVSDFLAAFAGIEGDAGVRCVILTGSGTAFSAGGNLRDMKRQAGDDVTEMQIRQEYRDGIQRLATSLFNLEVPVIAAVNGAAIGAGLDLACMCDIRIASERARFAESFVKLGLVSADGGAWLLPRIVGPSRAAEMAFTGDTLTAPEALACGLVSRVVPHNELDSAARELAGRIAANPSHALRLTKRLLREAQHARFESVLEMAVMFQAVAHKTAEHREAVDAFLEKRPPRFD